jgi:hypothetical protein
LRALDFLLKATMHAQNQDLGTETIKVGSTSGKVFLKKFCPAKGHLTCTFFERGDEQSGQEKSIKVRNSYTFNAFRSRALIEETRPQFEQVIWYRRDVVRTGMKNNVNFRACSSR